MNLTKRLFGLGLLSLLLISCGTNVKTNKKVALDLSSFSSYAFLPNQDTIKTSKYDNSFVNEIIIDEINNNMEDLNYRLDRNQPDLLVFYHVMMEEESPVNSTPVYTNYSYYRPGYYIGPYYHDYAYNNYFTIPRLAGDHIEQVPYKEGTIVIDIVDRSNNEIIWRGKANDVVMPDDLEQELRAYINAIFGNFPR